MNFLLRLCVFCILLLSRAAASTVVPPSFDELITRADAIVRGEVVAVRVEKRAPKPGADLLPFTIVTFRVERALAGEASDSLELSFLGGDWQGERLSLVGQPTFSVGDREILFVQGNGRQISPLVCMSYGRFPLVEDGAVEKVARNDGMPLRSVEEVSLPLPHSEDVPRAVMAASLGGAMTRESFEKQIETRVTALRGEFSKSMAGKVFAGSKN